MSSMFLSWCIEMTWNEVCVYKWNDSKGVLLVVYSIAINGELVQRMWMRVISLDKQDRTTITIATMINKNKIHNGPHGMLCALRRNQVFARKPHYSVYVSRAVVVRKEIPAGGVFGMCFESQELTVLTTCREHVCLTLAEQDYCVSGSWLRILWYLVGMIDIRKSRESHLESQRT